MNTGCDAGDIPNRPVSEMMERILLLLLSNTFQRPTSEATQPDPEGGLTLPK